ncbi:hypothetical protein AU210_005773 [Fusarium oxysporum f. sp. radicis-cucumerinum]|uniref:Uncharacterized protein n=3 Tax=Fusarium oxysporum TaxID=5507 RepID=A0A2H3H362_FUSOX|nr:hypothetical protein AU210_005773 [Fusarium oxysporum f. sp. radicis-cucumerinum]RKK22399.1 hypothetical protein BFJ65_g5001 [Fusarium oxysporum f. sp. cepae]RKL21059.1 hypothetical protein BFJ68_g2330 [Fusarium oxysporum]
MNTSEVKLVNLNLWYATGYGEQWLYAVAVQALYRDTALNTLETKTGRRGSQLVQEKGDHGYSLNFCINHIDIFYAVSCWIPAYSLLPSLDLDGYHA